MNISDFSQNDLILHCILKIEQTKEDCTFERLVYQCFTTFPDRFSFYTYHLPDSIKLDRQLRALRKLGLIAGNNTYGFNLTDRGHRLASKLQKLIALSSKTSPQKLGEKSSSVKIKRGRKEEIMINKIISSSLYKKYERNFDMSLTIDEIRVAFFGTLETTLQSLLGNIDYIKEIANKSQNADLLKFIDKCRKFIKNKMKG